MNTSTVEVFNHNGSSLKIYTPVAEHLGLTAGMTLTTANQTLWTLRANSSYAIAIIDAELAKKELERA